MTWNFKLTLLAAILCLTGMAKAGELQTPIRLTAVGKPIDVQRTAHSAPFVGDYDGDGLNDLLVGEFHEGRLRIFRNGGSNEKPKFRGYEWFKAGAELGRVPTG